LIVLWVMSKIEIKDRGDTPNERKG
jgi:hypothetical protein